MQGKYCDAVRVALRMDNPDLLAQLLKECEEPRVRQQMRCETLLATPVQVLANVWMMSVVFIFSSDHRQKKMFAILPVVKKKKWYLVRST